MANNLSCIGFDFDDAEEFQAKMLELATATVERVPCEAGDYGIWRSRTGAEIWLHVPMLGTEDNAADIAGLTPFFEGTCETGIEIEARVNRADDNAFEGAFHAWVLSAADGSQSFPVIFDAVDFAAHGARETPFQVHARLVGFVHAGEAFADLGAFEAASNAGSDGIAFAPKAFIPVGMFMDEGEETGEMSSVMLLTGEVVEHRLATNEASGGMFHAIVLDTLDMRIDLVAAPEAISGEIRTGGYLRVSGQMFGRLID